MSKREKCRFCEATLKHDKTSDQYDPEYCSGLCRKKDGAEPYVKTAKEQAMVVAVTKKRTPASLEDYKKNVPSKYARRFQPEKLNWSKNWMSEKELEQAGFRANREPIPGDWDYEKKEPVTLPEGAFRTASDTAKLEEEREKETARSIVENLPTDANILEDLDWNKLRARAKELGISIHSKKKEDILSEIAANIKKETENA